MALKRRKSGIVEDFKLEQYVFCGGREIKDGRGKEGEKYKVGKWKN